MVYSNHFVLCVLVDGKPQKEFSNGVVEMPFNQEYALRLRNKNNRRAVVKLYIDGENISGNGYIIPANDFIDVKRHHDVDRAFKFVSLDSEDAIDYGKNGPNLDKAKGTIEARFHLEKEQPKILYREIVNHHHHHHYDKSTKTSPPFPQIWLDDAKTTTCGIPNKMLISTDGPQPGEYGCEMSHMSFNENETKKTVGLFNFADDTPIRSKKLDDGCTVEGNETGQNFMRSYIDVETSYVSLKLFLQGFEDEKPEKKKSKKKKESRLKVLEKENEELRRKLAEIDEKLSK